MGHDVLNELQLRVLFDRNPKNLEALEWQSRAYEFWHKIWLNTFNELDGQTRLHSDDFLRQDEYSLLTYKNEVIAYHGYTFFNIKSPVHLAHSSFQAFPADTLQALRDLGLIEIMYMGYYSVAPEWRKTANSKWIAEILAFFAYKRFAESNADTLIGVTRNDRRVNELAARYGSRTLKSNFELHNVKVDMIYTLKNEIRDHDKPFIKNVIDRLWSQRIIYSDSIVRAPVRKAA